MNVAGNKSYSGEPSLGDSKCSTCISRAIVRGGSLRGGDPIRSNFNLDEPVNSVEVLQGQNNYPPMNVYEARSWWDVTPK